MATASSQPFEKDVSTSALLSSADSITVSLIKTLSLEESENAQRSEVGAINVLIANYPPTIPSDPADLNTIANEFIAKLNKHIAAEDVIAVSELFCEESYWRDHLAMTWDFKTLYGRKKISSFLKQDYGEGDNAKLVKIEVDTSNALKAPSVATIDAKGEVKVIRFFTKLETSVGRGVGVCYLTADKSGEWKIFAFYTSLRELKGHEEQLGERRPRGVAHGGLPGRKNWLETRQAEINYEEDREPTVMVVGAGQAGLTIGARLKVLGVDCLIVDRQERVGDNWRKRYHQLVLHDPVWYDHLPYLEFPKNWPIFTPKDKLAEWFEMYVKALELNVWVKTELKSSKWSDSSKSWTVEIQRTKDDGTKESRTFHPKYIIQATGHSGKINFPEFKGMDSFKGDRLCHSSQFTVVEPLPKDIKSPKKAVIVGSCNSGHDIAQSYYENGYDVTMVQRSSTCVVSSEALRSIALKGAYDESGPPHQDMDTLTQSMPAPLTKATHIQLTQILNDHDKDTLSGLAKAGFKVDMGPDDAGLIIKYWQRGGGYYIDVGASQLIADGKIKIKQGQEISEILAHGIRFADGSELEADELIFATGYQNMRTQARDMFGDELADRVVDVWGFDETGEMRGVGRPSGHPGFWFHGGNLFFCRYFSIFTALQILAREEGLITS